MFVFLRVRKKSPAITIASGLMELIENVGLEKTQIETLPERHVDD